VDSAIGQLDGLATTIRFRLSRRTCEGVWAGPDATTVGVVLAGLIGPLNPLPTLIGIAAACPSAGPDAMMVGGVFTGNPACTCGPKDGLPVCQASSGRLTRRSREASNLEGSGWPSTAMMPILLKCVGRHKPQYRVRKSTRFCCRDAGLVLATQAGDAAASMDDDIEPTSQSSPVSALPASLQRVEWRLKIALAPMVKAATRG